MKAIGGKRRYYFRGKLIEQPWSREDLPIGSVRVRRHSPRQSMRMVKVRLDGPKPLRWISLARHWWLNNRGPIPRGMRVVHLDGDPLNDDPGNYRLMRPGDVAYMARLWDPTVDARNATAAGAALARVNRDRGRVNRFLRYLPTSYYLVSPQQHSVINRPYRSRSAICRDLFGQSLPRNGGGLVALWLGWPGLSGIQARVLASLADGEPAGVLKILARIEASRTFYDQGRPQYTVGALRSAVCSLGRLQFLTAFRLPGRSRYRITAAALEARGRRCELVICRGREIEEKFPGFKKQDQDRPVEAAR